MAKKDETPRPFMSSLDKGPIVVRTPGQEILTVRYLQAQNGRRIVAGEEFCIPVHSDRPYCTFPFPLLALYSLENIAYASFWSVYW